MLASEALLEAFFPGYRYLKHLVSFYFRIDMSPYLLVAIALSTFWMYVVFWDRNVSQLLSKHKSPLDLDCQEDLSAFRVKNSPGQFSFRGIIYRIRVSAVVFSWPRNIPRPGVDNAGTNGPVEPRVLVLKRAHGDSKSGFWDSGPGGCVESEDATTEQAITREIREETGLHLSEIVRSLSVRHWTRSKHGAQHEWMGLSYIIRVSEADFPGSSTGFGIVPGQFIPSEKIRLDPQEHQEFAWATEAEVRAGKYQFYGNHQATLLEAFAADREMRQSFAAK